jgi:hypothetical protein
MLMFTAVGEPDLRGCALIGPQRTRAEARSLEQNMRRRRAGLAGTAAAWALVAHAAHAAGDLPVQWDTSHAGARLDLGGAEPVFFEGFDEPPGLQGPKLFAPVHAPYGAGQFDPPSGPAYHWRKGVLELVAYQDRAGRWRSGSVQTADAKGRGFACADCYFEARLRFPPGRTPGYWSAFWLLSPEAGAGHIEIDGLEWYGGSPLGHHHTVHLAQPPPRKRQYKGEITFMPHLDDGEWHDYGVRKDDDGVIVYVDGREVSRVRTGAAFRAPVYMLVSLAIVPKEASSARGPMTLAVDYLRAYRLK